MPELPIPESFPFPNINTKVSDNDVMLSGRDFKHYLALGVSAQQFISAATAFAGGVNVTDILDLPCGHGRVTRVLRAAFPNASIVVSDIDRDGYPRRRRLFCRRVPVEYPKLPDAYPAAPE